MNNLQLLLYDSLPFRFFSALRYLCYSLTCAPFLSQFSVLLHISFNFRLLLSMLSFFFLCSLFSSFTSISVFIQKMSTFSVSASRVLCATVNADPTVVPDDRFEALDALLTNKLAERAVNVQPVNLIHLRIEEPWLSIGQAEDSAFSLRNVQRVLVKNLVASMRELAFNYHSRTKL